MSAFSGLLDKDARYHELVAKHGSEMTDQVKAALRRIYRTTTNGVAVGAKVSTAPPTDVDVATAEKLDDTEKRQQRRTAIAGTAALVGGYVVALVVSFLWDEPARPTLVEGLNAFALLFVMALAIERIIEPFAPNLGLNSADSKEDIAELEKQKTEAEGITVPAAKAARLAELQEKLTEAKNRQDAARSSTAFVTWGVATGLAAIAAVVLNTTLFTAILTATSTRPPFAVDLLVTALAVGAGTKPLNDTWTRLQAKSNDDSAASK